MSLPITESRERLIGVVGNRCGMLIELLKRETDLYNINCKAYEDALLEIKRAANEVLRFNELANKFKEI
jgi:hypothetical protein